MMQEENAGKAMTRKRRYSNIELLRIIAMLFIVMHHFAVHSHWAFAAGDPLINKAFVEFMIFGGKIGVDIFVIISGYFLIRQTFRLRKLAKLLGQMWFYSAGIAILVLVLHFQPYNFKMLVKSLVPIYSINWFAYTYLVLYLLVPFINAGIKELSKTQWLAFLALGGVLWMGFAWGAAAKFEFSNLAWFVYLYALGGYLRLYAPRLSRAAMCRYLLMAYVLLFLCVFGFALAGHVSGIALLGKMANHFYAMNSPLVVVISVLMFLLFKEIDIGHINWVNRVAATTFGIYLIHDNPFVRPFLWQTLFQNPTRCGSDWLILYGLAEVAAVFIVCSLIDWLRIECLEKHLFAHVNPVLDRWEAGMKERWHRMMKRMN